MIKLRTLVLQKNYSPIGIFSLKRSTIPAADAITRVINGTCHVVLEYDREIKTQNPNVHINWPSVIARKESKIITGAVALSKEYLYYRDHAICVYCSKALKLHEMTIDHVIPKTFGGKHRWDNVVSSCGSCNHRKSDSMPVGQWKPKWKPFQPDFYQMLERRKNFPVTIHDESWLQFLGDWKGKVIVKNVV